MQELRQKFEELNRTEPPENLHVRLVRYILDRKLKGPFYVFISLITANLVFSGVNLFYRMAESEALESIHASLESFSPTSSFFSEFWTTLQESFPGHSFILFLLNAALFVYLVYILFKMKSSRIEKVEFK